MLMMPRKKVETEQVNVRISTALLSRLDKLGDPFGLTRTQMVLRAVEEYVREHDPEFTREVPSLDAPHHDPPRRGGHHRRGRTV